MLEAGRPSWTPVLHEGVEEGVGCYVSSLASVADGAGCGGDGDEEIEGYGGEGIMKIPGSSYL